jgi:protein-S-isoprenylcysteine O-methyltransferase Ste14
MTDFGAGLAAGMIIGLVIGLSGGKTQKNWSMMNKKEKSLRVIVLSVLFILLVISFGILMTLN